MKNPLSEQLRLHNGPDGFNDEKDRDAVRNFFSIDKNRNGEKISSPFLFSTIIYM